MKWLLTFFLSLAFSAETIYGVMLTGKDAIREPFSKLSIENFFAQTYPDKHLIIVNHSSEYTFAHIDPRITEICIEKTILGRMRNIALSHVPTNALFATWDDDDWRHPDMLQAQFDNLTKRKADCSAMRNRIEYIFKNNHAFYLRRSAMSALILCRKKPDITYSEKQSGEDWRYLDAYRKKYRLTTLNNPPHWYLRFQHGGNVTYNRWRKKRQGNDNYWDIEKSDQDYLKESLKKYQWVYDYNPT